MLGQKLPHAPAIEPPTVLAYGLERVAERVQRVRAPVALVIAATMYSGSVA